MASIARLSSSAAAATERREADRIDVVLWGRIRMRNGDAHPARLCNLSPGGFMAMTPVTIRKYSEVDVEIPVIGWKPAIVAWCDGDKMGCEFEPPMDPAVIERLLTFRK